MMVSKQQWIKKRTEFYVKHLADGSQHANKEADLRIARDQAIIEYNEKNDSRSRPRRINRDGVWRI